MNLRIKKIKDRKRLMLKMKSLKKEKWQMQRRNGNKMYIKKKNTKSQI